MRRRCPGSHRPAGPTAGRPSSTGDPSAAKRSCPSSSHREPDLGYRIIPPIDTVATGDWPRGQRRPPRHRPPMPSPSRRLGGCDERLTGRADADGDGDEEALLTGPMGTSTDALAMRMAAAVAARRWPARHRSPPAATALLGRRRRSGYGRIVAPGIGTGEFPFTVNVSVACGRWQDHLDNGNPRGPVRRDVVLTGRQPDHAEIARWKAGGSPARER
jgi:hypothetical protein